MSTAEEPQPDAHLPAAAHKCPICQALLDEEDLFCPNCGAEAPQAASDHDQPPVTREFTHNFTCDGCGASMSYDASAGTLRCPFCGSTKLSERRDAKTLRPEAVVPFVVERSQAEKQLRQWLGQGFWRPGDLAQASSIEKITPVYVPYWVFAAETMTYWTADTSQRPAGARSDWYPLAGQHQGQHSGLIIGASAALTPAETFALCPFDLSGSVPPERVDLDNVVVEQFSVPRKYARPLAKQALEAAEAQACQQQYVPGQCRNMHVSVLVQGLSSEPMLLPVWIMAYRYQDQLFRFLLNGQSGRSTGQAPTSWKKIAVAVAIVVVLMLLFSIALAR